MERIFIPMITVFHLLNLTCGLFLLLITPIEGVIESKNKTTLSNKVKQYHQQALWSLLPLIFIVLLFSFGFTSFNSIGIQWISLNNHIYTKVVIYIGYGLYFIHLLYNLYSISILKYNDAARRKVSENINKDVYAFLPITKREREAWSIVAIAAGFSEEIIYRGYLFYIIPMYLGSIHIGLVILVSSLIFAIGHLYQGKELIKTFLLGLLFGFYFSVLSSVIPVIIIHILQDLIVTYIFKDDEESKLHLTTAST